MKITNGKNASADRDRSRGRGGACATSPRLRVVACCVLPSARTHEQPTSQKRTEESNGV